MAKKQKQPLTDDEKFQLQLQGEMDLGRFQRQYTLMERDRSKFAEGSNGIMARQKHILSIFQHEHNNILTDLAVATAAEKKHDDQRTNDQLIRRIKTFDRYKKKSKRERNHIGEVEDQIKMVNKDVVHLQSIQITDRQYEERHWKGRKTLEALDNKLEVENKKFCTICCENREKRDLINHMMIERQNFLKIWDNLISNLQIGKKYMLDLIEQATIAYDQREEWCSKLQVLRLKAHNDFVNHRQEMQEFKRREDNERKLEEFFSIKGQKRVMRDLQTQENFQRECHRKAMEQTLKSYEEMISNIIEFSGRDRLDRVSTQYLKQEEDNFMLFQYINDLMGEMEKANDRLGFLNFDIDQKRVLTDIRGVKQKKKLGIKDKALEDAVSDRKQAEEQLKSLDAECEKLMQGIGNLFKICGCKNDPLIKLLGQNENIHHHNVLLYLDILEKKVLEMLRLANYKDSILLERKKIKPDHKVIKDDLIQPVIYNIEEMAKCNPCPLCVEHEMVSDVIDTLQTPLTRDEIKEKLKQRLELPDGLARVHNVSTCQLPKSRQIIQKRYQ